MNCTECGGKTETLDTRHDKGSNTSRRRRQCKDCGHRFATIETVEPEKAKAAPVAKPARVSQPRRSARQERRDYPERNEPSALLDSAWGAVPDRLNSLRDLDYL